ncbi:hypothetical protein HDU83_000767 [Entophlyctis luteolus]|nr:hypothetical protein HDU83_000767 [Entophlyctis luteolus]
MTRRRRLRRRPLRKRPHIFDNSIKSLLNDSSESPGSSDEGSEVGSASAVASMSVSAPCPPGWSASCGGEVELLWAGQSAAAKPITTHATTEVPLRIQYKDELIGGESFFGFIEDETDALVLIQATIANIISAFSGGSVDMAHLQVRSGQVSETVESPTDPILTENARLPGVEPVFSENSLKSGTRILADGEEALSTDATLTFSKQGSRSDA